MKTSLPLIKREYWLLAGLGLLAGCQLTSAEVEPPLPTVPIEGNSALVYRANGQPVVANNSTNLATIIVSFLGDPRAVSAKLPASGNLRIVGTDIHNQPAGYLTHSLVLELTGFHGAGAYSVLPTSPNAYPATYYQLTTYTSAGNPISHAEQYPVASAPAQVLITDWNVTTRHLAGTFAMDVAGPNNPQTPTRLTEGSFDLNVD